MDTVVLYLFYVLTTNQFRIILYYDCSISCYLSFWSGVGITIIYVAEKQSAKQTDKPAGCTMTDCSTKIDKTADVEHSKKLNQFFQDQ